MLPSWMHRLGPYGLAALLAVAGGLVRWALVSLVGPGLSTFITFYPFVMLAALVGGWGPGLLATLTAALWVNYWQMPPYGFGLERPADAVNLAIFCSIGMLMSVVAGLFQRTRGHLKELVQERTRQLETADGQLQAQAGELRTANEELRQSEYLRRLAEEITRVGAFEWNIITGVNTWTPELEALYGLPPGGFGGTYKAWEQLVHPEDRARAAVAVQRAFETNATVEDEWRVIWPDGSIHWVAGRFRILRDEAGQPRTLTGVNIDITERKQAEAELVRYREHLEELVQERAGQLAQANVQLQEQGKELAARAEELQTANGVLWEREQAVRESEEKYRRIVETATEGILMADAEARMVFVNDRWSEIFGYSPEEARQITLFDLVFPEDRDQMAERWESRERGQKERYEFRFRRKDGRPVWLQVGVAPRFDPEGRFLGTLGMVTDITKRKRTEEAIKQQADLLNLTHDTIFVRDARDRITFWNRGAEECYGWPAAEALGQVSHMLLATQFPKPLEEILRDLQANGQWEGELVHRTRDGRRLTVASRWSLQRSSDGTPVAILEINNDITARKAAEEALRESEERYRTLFQSSRDGIIFTDMEGRILHANPHYREMLGYSEEELHALAYQQLTPQRWQEMEATIVRDKIMSRGYSGEYEKEYIRKDGTVFPISIQVWLVRDAHGAPQGMWGIVRDITERKREEEMLREWNATLESKVAQRTAELQQRARQLAKMALELSQTEDRERKRMAEILHDDLQQQMAGAKFHLGLMRNRVKHDASLAAIGTEVDHMLKDAIERSRSLSHELSPAVLHHADFAETIRWLAKEVQTKHGLLVHVYAPDAVRLQSDALKGFLYRAAQELVFNIVKHAGVKEAEIRVRQCGGCICLSVSDRGRGFDPQELRGAAGFGLLSIRERIELLGGHMKIKSAQGKGSRFLMVVPNGEIPEDRGRKTEDGKKNEEGVPSPVLRVLLADDHEVVREGLRSLLSEEQDVEIVGEAANGREAVNLASQLKPDVIIMDMSMPLIEGDEATRQIKSYLPETRVIAISMYDQPEKMEAMYRAGAESYVLKTAPSEELLAAIHGIS